jgi:hypothetical protein
MSTIALNTSIAADPHKTNVLHCDPDLAIGASGDFVFTLWRHRTTVEGVRILANVVRHFVTGRTKGVGLFTIIEPQAKMPEAGSREQLAQMLKDASEHVLISCVAFEGSGFMAASVRSVVIGLTLLARQTYPHRVFPNVKEAALWIELESEKLGSRFDSAETQAHVAHFRRLVAMQV